LKSMNAEEVKTWVTTLVGISTAAVGLYTLLSLTREYKLKLQAEIRLKHITETELDMKLLTAFNEILAIAHAHSAYHIAEKAIEYLLTNYVKEFNHAKVQDILDSAVIALPVGSAMQDSAIAAIAGLGRRHSVLKQPAINALQRLCGLGGVKGSLAQRELTELLNLDLSSVIKAFPIDPMPTKV